MNYQGFANYNNIPPLYSRESEAYYDRGSGVPALREDNMTIQDIYRTSFLFLQNHHKDYPHKMQNMLQGVQSNSELSKLFFSDENIRRLQKMIKKEISDKTNGEFRLDVDQEQSELFIVMRAIYLENARFKPGEIVRQVKKLNREVITQVTPGIITSIRQGYGYQKDINSPLKPIDRPVNVSGRGRKTLPALTTTFF